ncbi:MAG: hypothetical protein AAGA96_12720 [Verrucomicrobiota bacterium]
MEKLNIRIFKLLSFAALVGLSSSAMAGQGFRFNSKAPVAVAPKQHVGYFFGYGGYSFGTVFHSRGAFDRSSGQYGYYANPTNIQIKFDTDGGWTAGGGFGLYSHAFGGSRFEIESSYITNGNGGDYVFDGTVVPNTSFRLRTNTAMVNFLKEIPFGTSNVVGYLGFGVGYASTKMEGITGTVPYDSRSTGFAYQFIAGVDFPISHNVALFTQYRYLVLDDPVFPTAFNDFNLYTNGYSNSSILFGARVSF